jgi:hypothetical protein
VEWGEVLFSKPRTKSDLTKHFDVAEVEIDPEVFSDYSRLKRAILGTADLLREENSGH